MLRSEKKETHDEATLCGTMFVEEIQQSVKQLASVSTSMSVCEDCNRNCNYNCNCNCNCNCSAGLLNWFLVFKLSPCCSNDKMSSGYFPRVWVLKADVSEHCVGSIFNFTLHHLLKREPTQCSETSAFNTQTRGKYPEDHLSLLKWSLIGKEQNFYSRVFLICLFSVLRNILTFFTFYSELYRVSHLLPNPAFLE